MQISGHNNVAFINNYSTLSEERHKKISNILSNTESRVVKPKIEMLINHPIMINMTVHTKWEILVQKLLKSVELFKSYGLFGEPKVVDFLFFGKM